MHQIYSLADKKYSIVSLFFNNRYTIIVAVPFGALFGIALQESIPESRLAGIEKTIHDHNYNLLKTTNRQQIEIDKLYEKIKSISSQIESDRKKERIDTEGTIDVGGITCKNAGDILLHGEHCFLIKWKYVLCLII